MEVAQKWAFASRLQAWTYLFLVPFKRNTTECQIWSARDHLPANIAKHDRQRSQRWGASSRGSGRSARSVCRLCKVIQRVMTEEQATADSGFSRYVGRSEGALVCIFLLPRLFLCCLSSHNRLSAYFFRDILLFSCFFGLLRDRGDCLDKVGNINGHWELRMETDWEGSCVCWQPHDLYSPDISLPSNQILFC